MECSESNVKRVKKCLMAKINKEESILECATVKLSVCSPQTGKVFRSFDKEGILCVIVDRTKSCLYLKQYDLIEFKVVFSIELYTNISDGYAVFGNHFHTIEFPGFFLGLSFPILDNPNVANRSSLIQKAIISNSKFISIKLNEYVYLHAFDNNKKLGKKYRHKGTMDRRASSNKIKNMIKSTVINNNNNNNMNDKVSNESKDNISNNNIDNENQSNNTSKINEDNKNNNNELESSKKLNKMKENNINKQENNEIIQEKNNNVINNNALDNNNNEEVINSLNNEINNNNINNNGQEEHESNNNIIEENKSIKVVQESKEEVEKKFFNSITIEDAHDDKIYKIVEFHLIREKNKVVKKLYKKNFYKFIDTGKISFDNIRYYKIKTYDFLDDIFSSSDEEEEQKTFVDYIPSKDIIGDLENEHIDDEDDRLKELIKKKNNLKEILKKNEGGMLRTTTAS